MFVVHKYPVPRAYDFTLNLPVGSKILSCQKQRDSYQLWICVDDGMKETSIRRFELIMTGHKFKGGTFIETL